MDVHAKLPEVFYLLHLLNLSLSILIIIKKLYLLFFLKFDIKIYKMIFFSFVTSANGAEKYYNLDN